MTGPTRRRTTCFAALTLMAAILLAGLNHRTATIDIRERFSLLACGADAAHGQGRQVAMLAADAGLPLQEMVVLSTCNRLEMYVVAQEAETGRAALSAYLAELYGMDDAKLAGLLYTAQDGEAVRHLMRVACGLDSLILGEPQILGQVAEACRAAHAAGSQGPLLSHLFHVALHLSLIHI